MNILKISLFCFSLLFALPASAGLWSLFNPFAWFRAAQIVVNSTSELSKLKQAFNTQKKLEKLYTIRAELDTFKRMYLVVSQPLPDVSELKKSLTPEKWAELGLSRIPTIEDFKNVRLISAKKVLTEKELPILQTLQNIKGKIRDHDKFMDAFGETQQKWKFGTKIYQMSDISIQEFGEELESTIKEIEKENCIYVENLPKILVRKTQRSATDVRQKSTQ